MNSIKHHAVNELPSDLEVGSIYYTINGDHYLSKLDGSPLKVSDIIFTEKLPELGVYGKLYIINDTNDIYVWRDDNFSILSVKGEKGDKGEDGENGLSAYELAVRTGFDGSNSEYLQSLKGKDGLDGIKGDKGDTGENGRNGLTSYELALANGFNGTIDQFLDSLKGVRGLKGDIGDKGDKGDDGERGEKGDIGQRGDKGDVGDSFYISAVYNSLNDLLADVSNPEIPEMAFVIISSDDPDNDEDNGKVYIKDNDDYKYLLTMRGLRGEKGERGDKGDTGERGLRGLQGIQGIQGVEGASGNITLKGILENEYNLPTTGENGDAYWVDSRLYVWSDNPEIIAQAGFVRGADLRGIQGIQGIKGERGEKGDTAIVQDASTTDKGVVSVGEGLKVIDGRVSVDYSEVNITSLPLTSPLSSYKDGFNFTRIPMIITDNDYILIANVVKDLIGTDLINKNTGNYFRIYVYTTKTNTYGIQKIEIANNIINNMSPIFELYRTYDNKEWTPFKAGVIENYGKINPEGTIVGVYGQKYTNVETNITYIKKGAVNDASAYNWKNVALKPYLQVAVESDLAVPNVSGRKIVFNGVRNSAFDYNPNTGDFKLEAGKRYRVKCKIALSGGTWLQYKLVENGVGDYRNSSGVAINANANLGNNSVELYTIVEPSATGNFSIQINASSGDPKVRTTYSTLIVEEI